MRNIKTLLIAIFLITCSCKNQNETVENYFFMADNKVDIPVNDDVKNALNYIANTQIKIASYCAPVNVRQYEVNFYFNITQEVKELIITQYFANLCQYGEFAIRKQSKKYTIPIQKIGNVNIEEPYNIYVDKSNKDIQQLLIKMDYNSNSIIYEYKQLNGDKFYSSEMNKENNNTCNDVYLEIPKNQIYKLQEAIDVLVKEYKI